MANSILIVEDDEILADNVQTYLKRNNWDVQVAATAEDALKVLEGLRPDVVLTDYLLPGKTGLELINSIMALDPQIKVIMMTGEGKVQTAVDAMKAGAYDYLTKPVVLAELKIALEKATGVSSMERALSFYQRREAQNSGLDAIIGESPAIAEVKRKVSQILVAERNMASGDLPAVLITGETGTGKELFARSLHVDGVRSNGPFVEVNCASIPSNLLESELFGHERGAFTVRRIGSTRERRVNIRIISATNQHLENMVRDGKFRADLFFRLRIITLRVPPLRERGDDVLRLARHFLEAHGKRYGKRGLAFSEDAEHVLMDYGWPGNVRELRNMLEQTVLLAQDGIITAGQLAICSGLSAAADRESGQELPNGSSAMPRQGMKLSDMERDLVAKTLDKTDWNVSKSAKLLGLSRDMLRYRIEKYGLVRPNE
ncbi:MAG: sigma-54-dependent Fis family transcriptional regulator [Proteobacteria bacterium]|nr:sigma-54-dependent Fis family transcriptional regulator [Pseudomonadota bacterium]